VSLTNITGELVLHGSALTDLQGFSGLAGETIPRVEIVANSLLPSSEVMSFFETITTTYGSYSCMNAGSDDLDCVCYHTD
jgi:hypothetical protein